MSAATMKKSDMDIAYPAATRFFEEIWTAFAAVPAAMAPSVIPKQLKASLNALESAPEGELAAVNAVLKEMSGHLSRMLPRAAAELTNSNKADAQFEKNLAAALTRKPGPMVTKRSKADGAALMSDFRANSAAALLARIKSKELLTSGELQDALEIRRQSISDALKSGRMFALIGPSGDNYYPAFYADPSLDRRSIEKVSKALGAIPAAAKYNFFTTKSHVLGTTPLSALRKGRLTEVLSAAVGFSES